MEIIILWIGTIIASFGWRWLMSLECLRMQQIAVIE